MAGSSGHGGYCAVCRHRYRGLYGVHSSTETHRAKQYRAHSKGGPAGRKHARVRTTAQVYAAQEREDASMVSVHDYYRNPPSPPWAASIKDKVWYVAHYWRRPPYRASSLFRPGKKRRRARAR